MKIANFYNQLDAEAEIKKDFLAYWVNKDGSKRRLLGNNNPKADESWLPLNQAIIDDINSNPYAWAIIPDNDGFYRGFNFAAKWVPESDAIAVIQVKLPVLEYILDRCKFIKITDLFICNMINE